MFYTGKSTACHTCRQRRLKCDEVRPHCLKCRRAGRECLGYRDESAFIIRDMTTATIQKFEHRPKPPGLPSPASSSSSLHSLDSPASSIPTDPAGPASSQGNAAGFSQFQITPTSTESPYDLSVTSPRVENRGREKDRRMVRKQKSLADLPRWRRKSSMTIQPALVTLLLEDRALCYFANRFTLAPTQYLDPGYLPVLKVVSQMKTLGPCLSSSLSAVSLAAFSTKLNARKAILRARAAYATALQMTNEAIQRPDSCSDDQLLASVVLLALFEVFCSDSILGWSSHIFGAAAMLGARGKVSLRNDLVGTLFRVVGNESVKLAMMGFSSPHTGTEVWTRWLTDPKYMTYITPDAKTAAPDMLDVIDLTPTAKDLAFDDMASVKNLDAVGQVQTGRAGTLPVPQVLPTPPVGYAGPQSDSDTISITQALLDTKIMIQAYSENQPPIPDLDNQSEPLIDFGQPGQLSEKQSVDVMDIDSSYEKLTEISLYVAACTARLVTYNVMARLAAALSYKAIDDYNEAVSMGRKEIREILRMSPHFFQLMEETGLTNTAPLSSFAVHGYESSSSDNSDSSTGSRDRNQIAKTYKRHPNLAKSYIGLMILWPIATAASTDLVDAEQFKYIMGMIQYIIEVCGIRMGEGVRQFCIDKRELSGVPFYT